ncbi:MFS transporter [Myceligenerans pegani]|uniref:MFS transporter n=1 Tax=Myceligenerans pegani TaxID=2776917 RepID=A0ABR9N588_9MICO|nr:MFS transporter [Myceligenerans sp. TRM 65318]MBE1878836.1 MFS transporter [Myceligenerans sp. TRM 65318]MBE3021107.1 MFS transporter [Myceligenerans sp. TRM 65318]
MPYLNAASRAVFVVFAASGFAFASWAARLPAVRDHLGLSEYQMGFLLLTAAIGSVAAIPLSGLIVQRIGTARTVLAFAVVMTSGVALAGFGAFWGQELTVRGGMILMGVGAGVWDAAMNLEGAAVEKQLGRSIMPTYHAGFSFGTVLGAGVGAGVAFLGVPLQWHLVGTGAAALASVVVSARYFLPESAVHAADDGARRAVPVDGADMYADPAASTPSDPTHTGLRGMLSAWREPRTLAIGLVVLAAALTEGVANDWVGLAVVDGFGVDNGTGAVGLAVFLVFMTVMRLAGTRAIDRFGRVTMLRVTMVLAIAGVAIFALVPWLWLALVGVALWGMGAALGFPMGMSASSDDPERAPMRLAAASTIGYGAFFIGPPLIGFLADHTGYRLAVLVLAVPTILGLAVSAAIREPAAAEPAPSR